MGHTLTVAYEDTIMVDFQWETYTPYSIGFNETFSRLEFLQEARIAFLTTSLMDLMVNQFENRLKGFSAGDIEVETERNVLTVSARKSPEEKERIIHTEASHTKHFHETGRCQMMR